MVDFKDVIATEEVHLDNSKIILNIKMRKLDRKVRNLEAKENTKEAFYNKRKSIKLNGLQVLWTLNEFGYSPGNWCETTFQKMSNEECNWKRWSLDHEDFNWKCWCIWFGCSPGNWCGTPFLKSLNESADLWIMKS